MRTMAAATAALAMVAIWCGVAAADEPGLVGTWTVKTDQAQIETTYSADGSYVCKVVPAGGGETRTYARSLQARAGRPRHEPWRD